MEEGKFVRPDTGNLVDEMEVEQAPVVHKPKVEKVGSGPGDNKELHGEGGPNDLHGDSNLELNALDNGDIGVAKDVGPTSCQLFLAADNAKLVGSGDGPYLNAPLRNMAPESPTFLRPMEASDKVTPDSYPASDLGIGLERGDINNEVELTV
ncbi:hypothetical protein L1987_80512 [Smallanthus sonchifolius]|uniref:Uncharacterized protein n=1 Tax=Smallanthus sonchifolius TaxID=185202 RepID=A0ACB8YNY0_9ASTR|nr:hypothetical protein L1987_80512 [Smallanthus sonchifolius]